MKDHPYCRPPRGATKVLRLGDDGQWRDDNGRHGRAFLGTLPETPEGDAIAWVAFCRCKPGDDCPLHKATEQAVMLGAAFTSVQRRRAYHTIPAKPIQQPKPKPKRKRK